MLLALLRVGPDVVQFAEAGGEVDMAGIVEAYIGEADHTVLEGVRRTQDVRTGVGQRQAYFGDGLMDLGEDMGSYLLAEFYAVNLSREGGVRFYDVKLLRGWVGAVRHGCCSYMTILFHCEERGR